MKKISLYCITLLLLFSTAVSVQAKEVKPKERHLSMAKGDTPKFYTGVDRNGTGITEKNQCTLAITLTGGQAWDFSKAFTVSLPKGVYVTKVEIKEVKHLYQKGSGVKAEDFEKVLKIAYRMGEFQGFSVPDKTFDPPKTGITPSVTMAFFLVAEPTVVGDMVVGFQGEGLPLEEGCMGEMEPPFTVQTELGRANLDYRCMPTAKPVVITEAKAGLLDKGAFLSFGVDRKESLARTDTVGFSDYAEAVSKASQMKIKTSIIKEKDESDQLRIDILEKSKGTKAVLTLAETELIFSRGVLAGDYDLRIASSMEDAFLKQVLYGGAPEDVVRKYAQYDHKKRGFFEAFYTLSETSKERPKIEVKAGEEIILINGKIDVLSTPVLFGEASKIMIPIEMVEKIMGDKRFFLVWEEGKQTATLTRMGKTVVLTGGRTEALVGGRPYVLTTAPKMVGDVLYIDPWDMVVLFDGRDLVWGQDGSSVSMYW